MSDSSVASGGNSHTVSRNVRGSRGVFPRVPVAKVVPLVQAIWDEGHGEPVRMTAAFDKLERSATSGPSRALIAAANSGYGLIKGNAASSFLELTDTGKALAETESTSVRRSELTNAVLGNEIARSIHERWLNKPLPSDQVVSDYAKSVSSLSDDESELCWQIISENFAFVGLVIQEGGKQVLIAPSTVHEDQISQTRGNESNKTSQPSANIQSSTHSLTAVDSSRVSPNAEFHFNIQIHLPSDADPEVYDAIFSSISKNLLNSES